MQSCCKCNDTTLSRATQRRRLTSPPRVQSEAASQWFSVLLIFIRTPVRIYTNLVRRTAPLHACFNRVNIRGVTASPTLFTSLVQFAAVIEHTYTGAPRVFIFRCKTDILGAIFRSEISFRGENVGRDDCLLQLFAK